MCLQRRGMFQCCLYVCISQGVEYVCLCVEYLRVFGWLLQAHAASYLARSHGARGDARLAQLPVLIRAQMDAWEEWSRHARRNPVGLPTYELVSDGAQGFHSQPGRDWHMSEPTPFAIWSNTHQ